MNKYRYIVYYERDRDDWRDGTISASTLEEALSKTCHAFRYTPWTVKRVELAKDNSLIVNS